MLPHEHVWARLGVSRIHGVGAFAIRPIPAGTDVFANDQREINWVDMAAMADLGPEQRAFYHDFGIARDGRIGCPPSFDLLTIGWYVNEPAAGEEPNLRAAEDYRMFARRDIAKGEELTIRYATFSDPGSVP